MLVFIKRCVLLLCCGLFIMLGYLWLFQNSKIQNDIVKEVDTQMTEWSQPTGLIRAPASCVCPNKSLILEQSVPLDIRAEVTTRRANEYQKHLNRTRSILNTLIVAPPNSPLQYPIQGFTVQPLAPTLIPGLALHSEQRSSYKVSLNVTRGVLSLKNQNEADHVKGDGTNLLILDTQSLEELNNLLARVTYASTMYHINTGDLVHFLFEGHEAVFPIAIRQPRIPVLYDMGSDINKQVTVTTKTFMRYSELKVLIESLRRFYKDMILIVADDSFKKESLTEKNVLQYMMPGGQGWFAGRNLAVSQVTTKYFLWVDDDFEFSEKTKIEDLVEVMESTPDLDVVGGSVGGNQFYFSIAYQEGDEVTGGCLHRKSNGKFHSLPNYPHCYVVNGVVNFFLARTDAVQRVGFDPKLKRVAHSEFFMDGLGQLMVVSCGHVSINHQQRKAHSEYSTFRHPGKGDEAMKKQLHYYKNYLQCILYG